MRGIGIVEACCEGGKGGLNFGDFFFLFALNLMGLRAEDWRSLYSLHPYIVTSNLEKTSLCAALSMALPCDIFASCRCTMFDPSRSLWLEIVSGDFLDLMVGNWMWASRSIERTTLPCKIETSFVL